MTICKRAIQDALLPIIPLLLFVGRGLLSCSAFAAVPDAVNLTNFLYAKDDLGAVYSPQATTIKLWAPIAEAVRVILFADASSSISASIPMARENNDIWTATLEGDQDGKYYLYEITRRGGKADEPALVRVNDPYARGCSANTGRTLIYDPKKTNPDGWANDRFVALRQNVDAVLYEMHIRDFSINKNSGTSGNRRGKYLGLVQPGTRTSGGEHSGIDHLKELCVTHVHLLPTFDYANGDERQAVNEYTWFNW